MITVEGFNRFESWEIKQRLLKGMAASIRRNDPAPLERCFRGLKFSKKQVKTLKILQQFILQHPEEFSDLKF
ncbi:MAG: hypothetical protein JKY49_14905 [Cohaesibacteraceae bacterium]|nr:hypothetical protein [Cohaesibacteraceae bacterium]